MTIIEFYDKNAIENIAGAMMCQPDRVVLVGDNREKMIKSCDTYQDVLRANGINTKLFYSVINKTNLSNIVEGLERVIAQMGDCIFDLTGGDELYLVAVGMLKERHGEKVQCHRFNFVNDTVSDCDADGKIASVKSFDISIEDNIAIYGGSSGTDSRAQDHSDNWEFDDEFLDDIEKLWSVCKQDPGAWNTQVGIIGRVCDAFGKQDSLSVSYDSQYVNKAFGKGKDWYWIREELLQDLHSYGLIRYRKNGETVSVKFKNERVKRCLTVAGQVLERFIASRICGLLDEDQRPMYHDVQVGVFIRWDDEDNKKPVNVINEIDVMAMKGAIPVFISCKNGFVEVDELYKLNTVAKRFGGKYAKRVLVTSSLLESNSNVSHLKARMQEMGIIHIDNIYRISDHDLGQALSSLWKDK
ncbi:MAG: DUF1887 family protein [Clostridia bacterium]|nr:DUF1887 family protein [Clostridia bacterium]